MVYSLISGSLILFSLGWFCLYNAFYVNNYNGLILPIFLFLFAFALFYFLVVIEHNLKVLYIVCSLGMLGAVSLGREYLISSFLVWILTSISCILAIKRIKTEQYNRIKISVYRTLKRGIPIIGTVFCLLIAVGFYFSIANFQNLGNIPRFKVKLPIETTKLAFGVMNAFMPNEEISWIVEGVTVDEYFQKILRSQDISLEGTVLQEIKNEVDEDTKKQMAAGIEREIWEKERTVIVKNREMLQDKLGIELEGNERIDEVLHGLINKRLNDFINGRVVSSDVLPVGGAFALFITLRSIVWVSNMILFWTVSVIFSILVRLGKIKIKKENQEVEVIEI
ncbi:hypothetical protein HOD82_04805 [bacterium]|nr:hypothetical protein [bacterium]MBT4251644.1 hypothetical protein [bacterium]